MPEDRTPQQQEPGPVDPAGEFYGQFSEACRGRARRIYLLQRTDDGEISRIGIVCPVHSDGETGPVPIADVAPGAFRRFLQERRSVECPRGDTVPMILPVDMKPSLWRKAKKWEKNVILSGVVFLAFLVLFFVVRGCRYAAKYVASPERYQTSSRRRGMLEDVRDGIAEIEVLIAQRGKTGQDADAAALLSREIETRKQDLIRTVAQAKLRDKALVNDPGIREIEQRLEELGP